VNGHPVGAGVPGPMIRRIQQAFRDLVSDLSGG
jgi:hypothetical protein